MLTKNTLSFLTALAMLAAIAVGESSAEDFVVIVNPSNSVMSLTKSEVADFFLKRKSKWSGGMPVLPADLGPRSEARAAFSESVVGRPVASVASYWQHMIFSGRGVPPRTVASAAAMIAHVRGNAGAIGYVAVGTPLDGVKPVIVK